MASRADQMASNLNLSKFGQATELKNRIWFTIGALIVFRLLSFVPLPGVDPIAQAALYANKWLWICDIVSMVTFTKMSKLVPPIAKNCCWPVWPIT